MILKTSIFKSLWNVFSISPDLSDSYATSLQFYEYKVYNTTYDVDKIEPAMIDQSLIIHRKKAITLTIGGYTVTGINFATIIIVSDIHGSIFWPETPPTGHFLQFSF